MNEKSLAGNKIKDRDGNIKLDRNDRKINERVDLVNDENEKCYEEEEGNEPYVDISHAPPSSPLPVPAP